MFRYLALATTLCLVSAPSQAATYNYSSTGIALADYCDDANPCKIPKPNESPIASQSTPYSFGSINRSLSAAPRLWAAGAAGLSGGNTSSSHFQTRGGGSGYLSYYMQLTGPAGGSVPVHATGEAKLSVTGGPTNTASANAYARLAIVGEHGPLAVHELGIAYDQYSTGGSKTSGFKLDQDLILTVGALYQVAMNIGTSASFTMGGSLFTSGPFTAEAYLDPYFELSAASAAMGYALEFSPGIVNSPVVEPPPVTPAPVPLPPAAALSGAGLLALAGAAARRRRA